MKLVYSFAMAALALASLNAAQAQDTSDMPLPDARVMSAVATTPAATSATPAVHRTSARRGHSSRANINGPYPDPDDASLVKYDYDPDYSYKIVTQVDEETHLVFAPDEQIVAVYLSDNGKRWLSHKSITGRDFFIAPRLPGLRNIGTVITSKRRYEIDLRSTDNASAAFHRVSWFYADVQTSAGAEGGRVTPFGVEYPGSVPRGVGGAYGGSSDGSSGRSGPHVDLTHANFDYQTKGSAPFTPMMVFDDGQFTYFQLPHNAALSAVFLLDKNGSGEITDFAPIGNDFYKIGQVVTYGLLLKRGKDEVRIFSGKADGCGLFGCNSSPAKNIYGKS